MTPLQRHSIDLRVSARIAAGIWAVILSIACFTFLAPAAEALDVPKWRRHVIALTDSSYSGNPFEVVLDATFTHTASGTQLTLPGYYNGNDRWEIGFMPTRLGTWSWVTSSPDPDLDGRTGSLECVASGHPGMLTRDPLHPRKWKFTDGGYAVPMAFRMEFFVEPASDAEFAETADFLLHGIRGHLLETRLLEQYGRFDGRTDFIFEGDWENHRFDLEVWNRMARRMEMLTERGLGAHVMFYSDDIGTPDWDGRSPTEALVIRYAVARLAGYPTVWFNTGTDIGEYRNDADIDWFGERIAELDPYDHPRSSRTSCRDRTTGSSASACSRKSWNPSSGCG